VEETDRARWIALVREDETARSTQFAYHLQSLQLTHRVLNLNYVELQKIPEVLNKDRSLLAIERRPEAMLLHVEFVRRHHNWLASVKSLVDHTRTFCRRWPHDDIAAKLASRIQSLQAEPVVKFVQELRNPTQHDRLPEIARVTTLEPLETGPNHFNPVTRLMVSTDNLRGLGSWSRAARRYIVQAADKENLDLMQSAREYQKLIGTFYEWFYDAVVDAHRPLWDDFTSRREELVRLQSRAQRGTTA